MQLGHAGQGLGHPGRRPAPGPALQLQEPLGEGVRLIELAGLAQLINLLRQLGSVLDLAGWRRR